MKRSKNMPLKSGSNGAGAVEGRRTIKKSNEDRDRAVFLNALRQGETGDDLVVTLRRFLELGGFESGYRLPRVRQFQEWSGLGYYHITRALDILEAEGRIVKRRGAGTFVAGTTDGAETNAKEALQIGVIPPIWDPGFTHNFVANLLSGMTERCGLHHRLHMASGDIARLQPVEFVNRIRSWGLDGLIWVKPPVSPPLALVRLLDAGMPMVVVGRSYDDLPIKAVIQDHSAVGEVIADYVVSKRRRKLLCMVGVRNDSLTRDHVKALQAAMARRDLPLPDDQIITVRLESAATTYTLNLRRLVLDFLNQHSDFDAVFSMYPDQLGTLAELHEANIRRCPEDFIHIHEGQLNVWPGQAWPPFPSAFLCSRGIESGRQAVKELERLLGVGGDVLDEDLSPKVDYDPYV